MERKNLGANEGDVEGEETKHVKLTKTSKLHESLLFSYYGYFSWKQIRKKKKGFRAQSQLSSQIKKKFPAF